ncbi:hypothetical protein ACVWYF_001722 [Hymenobacter sp. UYAg731]
MTPPEFSVLLLAWDDADPTVAVLGGAALPPTLPLVYQLAARQPVLAVYPHLPASKTPVKNAANAPQAPAAPAAATSKMTSPKTATANDSAAVAAASEASIDALATAVNGPGVQVLPTLVSGTQTVVAALQSRIVGLADLAAAAAVEPAGRRASAALRKPLAGSPLAPAPAPSRSQWPTGANAPALAGQWQAPAAPYLGAGSGGFFPPPPAPPRPLTAGQGTSAGQPATSSGAGQPNGAATSAATSTPTATLRLRPHPQAGDLNFDPDPELPAVQHPAIFQETTEEIGAAEAADISAPEDDIVPNAPAADTERPEAARAVPVPAPTAATPTIPAVLTPRLDGLNFRMIQYARQAAQLVRGRSDFGVIYAPSWPAWLAALEIRNSSGRPLVLYVASLALDLPNPAEHGYQLEMERMAMRRARLVLVPDEALRRRLLALYEDAAGKVRVVAADDETAVQQALGEVAMG